uniref:vomeronasal type-1 receptor 4-like n=1 Tax=Jaculus jaculus TaxID=51337 RepID=UPI001E1B33D0|nr:vomeronasal type-1 receptor 4-like [Jaculus jaculus]
MKMLPENMAIGIFLSLQNALGILGNSLILCHYVFLVFTRKNLMPKDLIIRHLAFANFFLIISKGIPQTISEFGLEYFLDDMGCKLVMYIYRVSRGVSLHNTGLLSCFQALTISPSNSRWGNLRYSATKHMSPSCLLSWLLHLLLNAMTPARVAAPSYHKNGTNTGDYGYCSWFHSGTMATILYMAVLCMSDGLCLALMAYSSVTMVNILYRHRRQVKYIQTAQHSPRVSPVARATQAILILVCTFVSCYFVSSILLVFMTYSNGPGRRAINMFTIIEICFPTLCPFILISNNNSATRLFLPTSGRR